MENIFKLTQVAESVTDQMISHKKIAPRIAVEIKSYKDNFVNYRCKKSTNR